MNEKGIAVYDFLVDGCACGLQAQGVPVEKKWRILTSSEVLKQLLQHKCPGHAQHVHHRDLPLDHECRRPIPYPPRMAKKAALGISATLRHKQGRQTLMQDVEDKLLDHEWFHRHPPPEQPREKQLLALSRQSFPEQAPTGKKLEAIKQMMMRVHRACGHASMASLAKLLAQRGAPSWAQVLA